MVDNRRNLLNKFALHVAGTEFDRNKKCDSDYEILELINGFFNEKIESDSEITYVLKMVEQYRKVEFIPKNTWEVLKICSQ